MIFLTGANGFIGREFRRLLAERDAAVRLAVRSRSSVGASHQKEMATREEIAVVGDIGPYTDWRSALRGADVVVHLAAHVHRMGDQARATARRYWEVNVLGSERLARQAAASGVRRLVFCSSIKAREVDLPPATAQASVLSPGAEDPYALSKREAERRLFGVAAATGLEVVVVRPPLVYGPGVKANFLRLLRLVDRGVPLPLAWVHNVRSLVFSGNLVHCLWLCSQHPAAGGHLFEVGDGEDLSTPELLLRIGEALGRPVRLWPCPMPLLRGLGRLLAREAEIERLCGSLQVDDRPLRRLLGWRPPFSVAQGLAATVDWYRGCDQQTC